MAGFLETLKKYGGNATDERVRKATTTSTPVKKAAPKQRAGGSSASSIQQTMDRLAKERSIKTSSRPTDDDLNKL